MLIIKKLNDEILESFKFYSYQKEYLNKIMSKIITKRKDGTLYMVSPREGIDLVDVDIRNSLTNEEDIKIFYKWKMKKNNSALKGLNVFLTYHEYKQLLINANIKADQIGKSSLQYNLARYNDKGDYKIGNCRFITHDENMMERKTYTVTDKVLETSKRNINNYNSLPMTEERRKMLSDNGKKLGNSLSKEHMIKVSKLANHKRWKHEGSIEECVRCNKC